VKEIIRKLVKNPKFEEAILNKIGSRIDTEEIEKEIERLEKQHRQLTGAKGRLGQQMDSLDIMDKFYEKKYQDMETRLYRLYDEIEGVENSIEEVKNRLLNIRQQKISEENVYQFLLYFDKLYDKFTDLEKKEFLCRTGGHLRAGAAGWQIPEAHKVPFPGVFWRQRDTGTLLGQRKYR